MIENFCKENEKFVKHHAKKLLRKNGVNFDDLYQEGMLSLILLYNSRKLNDIPSKKHSGYISTTIRRRLLKHISRMTGAVTVSHNKFFDTDFVPLTFENADSQIDESRIQPDEAMVKIENQFSLNFIIIDVIRNMTDKELFVWNTIIMAEKPLTVKQAAVALGYKSGGSITYIKKKIINKIKGGIPNE